MLRRLAKLGMCTALHKSGAARHWAERGARAGLPLVVAYHRVLDDPRAVGEAPSGMAISVRMLERHLEFLGSRFRLVSLDELGEAMAAGRADSKMAAVTFDDGYLEVYEHAFPLLTRKGIPLAVFAVTDLVGTSEPLLHDRLWHQLERLHAQRSTQSLPPGLRRLLASGAGVDVQSTAHALLRSLPQHRLRQLVSTLEADDLTPSKLPPLMTWEHLKNLREAGVVIGSHTRSHAMLTHDDDATLRAELAGSRRALEEALASPVKHFAYAGGEFNPRLVGAVGEAGFTFAYTTCAHRDPERPRLTIPRLMLWERSSLGLLGEFSPAVLACQAAGIFDVVSHCGRHHQVPRQPATQAA